MRALNIGVDLASYTHAKIMSFDTKVHRMAVIIPETSALDIQSKGIGQCIGGDMIRKWFVLRRSLHSSAYI